MINSTFSENVANGDLGGAITGLGLVIQSSTIVNNRVESPGRSGGGLWGQGVVWGSVIANNSAPLRAPDCDGSFTSRGYNLIGDASDCDFEALPSDLVGEIEGRVDPLLGPLADNGGATLTHKPLEDSPVLDVIPEDVCLAEVGEDQRGQVRPLNGRCEIGALEVDSGLPGDFDGDGDVDGEDDRARTVFQLLESLEQLIEDTRALPHPDLARMVFIPGRARAKIEESQQLRERYYPYEIVYRPRLFTARFMLDYHAYYVERARAPRETIQQNLTQLREVQDKLDDLIDFPY
ncbi:MAG: hypothetical protein GY725_12955 [bacterium]|nr:hypothetical protein [bacterium]